MTIHKYILEKGIKKYDCPSCRAVRRFRRYIDSSTGNHISIEVGLCDRENSCGYHYPPKQYFADNPDKVDHSHIWQQPEPIPILHKPIEYLPIEYLEKSVQYCDNCDLFRFFSKLFSYDVAVMLCVKYFIGTNKNYDTVFWQVDFKAEIRQAKVMQYNPVTGRRNKETGALFIGKRILNNPDANLQQCFFGESLLALNENKGKVVAIFESEKSAAIASIYYPDWVCIATGGKYGCKWTDFNVCKVLAGRKVLLFPDLGAYDSWVDRGKLLANTAGCKVVVSDTLEKFANEADKKNGLDIADYLLRVKDDSGLALTDKGYPVIWDLKNIKE